MASVLCAASLDRFPHELPYQHHPNEIKPLHRNHDHTSQKCMHMRGLRLTSTSFLFHHCSVSVASDCHHPPSQDPGIICTLASLPFPSPYYQKTPSHSPQPHNTCYLICPDSVSDFVLGSCLFLALQEHGSHGTIRATQITCPLPYSGSGTSCHQCPQLA